MNDDTFSSSVWYWLQYVFYFIFTESVAEAQEEIQVSDAPQAPGNLITHIFLALLMHILLNFQMCKKVM